MALSHQFRALRHRDFRLYVTGQFVSVLGTWMQSVAQSWLMYRLTESEFLLGLTFFCSHAPVLLLSTLGGWAADRFPRRRIVLVTQALAAMQALAMAALTMTGVITAHHVLAMAALLGTIHAFDIPARQTLFIQMVGKPDLTGAIALNSAAFNAGRVIGPAIAGVLVAAYGEALCFLLNALSFSAVLYSLITMSSRQPGSGGDPAQGGLLDGFRYVWRSRPLRTVLGMSAAVNLCYGPVLALGPFFADGIFRRGSQGLGFLIGSMGVGAVLGVLHLARLREIGPLAVVMLQSGFGMAAGLLVYALSPSFWVSLAVMPLLGGSAIRQNAAGNSLVQSVVAESFRGRVMAVYSMTVTGATPLGTLAAGALAQLYGPRWVVAASALLCLLAAIRYRVSLANLQDWVAQQEEQQRQVSCGIA